MIELTCNCNIQRKATFGKMRSKIVSSAKKKLEKPVALCSVALFSCGLFVRVAFRFVDFGPRFVKRLYRKRCDGA